MIRHLLCGLTAAMLLAPTLAQSAEPAPPSARKLELAHQLMQASGGEEQARKKLAVIFGAAGTIAADNLPASARALALQTQTDMHSYLSAAIPQILAISEHAYAENLTEKELSDEIAWLNSESGHSILAKSSAITTEVILAERPLFRNFIPSLTKRALDRACLETKCSDQDKQVIASRLSTILQKPG